MTVKAYEDHRPLKELTATPRQGHVMLVDAGDSLRVTAMGDIVNTAAVANGWVGAVICGKVLVSGLVGTPLSLVGLTAKSGDWIHADRDAMGAAPRRLRTSSD